MTVLGIAIGVGLYLASAWLGEKQALWIPGVVVIASAVAALLN